MACSVDIVEFLRPDAKDKNLYVTGISNRLSEADVTAKLNEIFTGFGLLYEVQVLGGNSNQSFTSEGSNVIQQGGATARINGGSGCYAFVKYYSSQAARNAQQATNANYVLDGRLLKVKFAVRQKLIENCPQLDFRHCCELASYYLGFNGWTSQIIMLKEDKDPHKPNDARFIAVGKIDIRQHNMHSEGVGVGEFTFAPEDLASKLTAFHRAKKIAYQRAIEDAFSKIVIAVLPNGKVAVDVNCTATEALPFVTPDELKGVVKVTQVEPMPSTDDPETDDIEGALAVDDTSDLDSINAQLLLDLQTDM